MLYLMNSILFIWLFSLFQVGIEGEYILKRKMLSTAGRIHCVSTMRLNIDGSYQYSSVIFDRFNVTISKDTINGQWPCVGDT